MFELQHVAVGYDAQPVLRDVSFTAQDGQITALVGTNGCGKTTLLKAIARQLPLQQGQILLQGRSIQSFDRKEFARAAAFMPQVRNIPEITVRGLVSHGRFPYLGLSRQMTTKDRTAVEKAMQATGVARWADRDLRELSGGERQRVYLAMALAQGGDTILLDEPTSNLDSLNEAVILKSLHQASDDKTVVLISHRASTMKIADDVYNVECGRMS